MFSTESKSVSATIADISLLSIHMESDQTEDEDTTYTAEAYVNLNDPQSKTENGMTALSASVEVIVRATDNTTNEQALSISLEAGGTIIGDVSYSEEALWGLAVDAILGYVRTTIHTLTADSAIKEGLYLPPSSGINLIHLVREMQSEKE